MRIRIIGGPIRKEDRLVIDVPSSTTFLNMFSIIYQKVQELDQRDFPSSAPASPNRGVGTGGAASSSSPLKQKVVSAVDGAAASSNRQHGGDAAGSPSSSLSSDDREGSDEETLVDSEGEDSCLVVAACSGAKSRHHPSLSLLNQQQLVTDETDSEDDDQDDEDPPTSSNQNARRVLQLKGPASSSSSPAAAPQRRLRFPIDSTHFDLYMIELIQDPMTPPTAAQNDVTKRRARPTRLCPLHASPKSLKMEVPAVTLILKEPFRLATFPKAGPASSSAKGSPLRFKQEHSTAGGGGGGPTTASSLHHLQTDNGDLPSPHPAAPRLNNNNSTHDRRLSLSMEGYSPERGGMDASLQRTPMAWSRGNSFRRPSTRGAVSDVDMVLNSYVGARQCPSHQTRLRRTMARLRPEAVEQYVSLVVLTSLTSETAPSTAVAETMVDGPIAAAEPHLEPLDPLQSQRIRETLLWALWRLDPGTTSTSRDLTCEMLFDSLPLDLWKVSLVTFIMKTMESHRNDPVAKREPLLAAAMRQCSQPIVEGKVVGPHLLSPTVGQNLFPLDVAVGDVTVTDGADHRRKPAAVSESRMQQFVDAYQSWDASPSLFSEEQLNQRLFSAVERHQHNGEDKELGEKRTKAEFPSATMECRCDCSSRVDTLFTMLQEQQRLIERLQAEVEQLKRQGIEAAVHIR